MSRWLLLLVLLVPAAAAAQDTRVTGDVDARRVGIDDTVDFTVTIEGPAQLAADVELPVLRNLTPVAGPSVSTQIAFVNGAMSQSRSYTWTLRPYATGRAEIAALTVKLQGGNRSTAPIAIDVVSGSVRPRPAAQGRLDPFGRLFADPAGSVRARAQEPQLVVEVQPSRQRLYVGEALVLTYVLYTQTRVEDLQFATAPEFPGFWSEELDRPETQTGGEPVERDGQRYRRFPFLKRLLFPTRSGRITIPPVTLRMNVPGGSLFEPRLTVQRSTRAVTIEALPLPDAPGASGAVGRFEATASLEPSNVALGEAATLRFSVTGVGNLKWVERAPEVQVAGARVYAPQVKDALRPTDGGLAGTRTWSYVIVPETAGILGVPPLTFAWFDPAAGRPASMSTAPLTLTVAPSPQGPAASGGRAAPRARGGLALRAELDPPAGGGLDAGRTVALGLAGAAALHLLVFAGFGLADRQARRSGHAARGAVRSAVSELQDVARGGRTKEEAAALVEKALHEAFGDVDALEGDGERERAVRQLHQEVQFLRYAPQLGEYADRIRDLARRAEQAVRTWA